LSAARLLAGLAAGVAPSLDNHLELFGPLERRDDLIVTVERAGLVGRGGGAFPTATKLRAVATSGRQPVVVANAVEGEPASGKDRALLRIAPHLVLDGVVAASHAVGARDAVVAISSASPRERAIVETAIGQRRARGGGGEPRLRTASVPDRFIAGEETALVSVLSGREAKPSLKPPFPFEQGLDGAPTLVANAETLAHVALIARFGANWFRGAGTDDAPGTALVTVGGAVARPGVYEIGLGTCLDDVVDRAGGTTQPAQAILVGGYFGRWVMPRDAHDLRLTPDVLGAGAIAVLPADVCAVAECARVLRYLADESAGQCGPCVHGLRAIAEALSATSAGIRRPRLEELAGLVSGRGACRHPDGAAGFLRSALDVFADEFAQHEKRGHCSRQNLSVLPLPLPLPARHRA
jgi:NADH:ubiquinone oxidoreductase subunit F (NADH-binding)